MNRRDILRYAATITGSAIIAPLTASMLLGCSEHTNSTVNKRVKGKDLVNNNDKVIPEFFGQQQFKLISQVMDTILPKTDSPSATEVQVNYILDNMLAKIFPLSYQQQLLKKMAIVEQHLNAKNFIDATSQAQKAALIAIETSDKSSPLYRAYLDLKQQTISYFLSTEKIAENYLNYLPIPSL